MLDNFEIKDLFLITKDWPNSQILNPDQIHQVFVLDSNGNFLFLNSDLINNICKRFSLLQPEEKSQVNYFYSFFS